MDKLLLIVIIQLIYVPLLTLRTIFMVKNIKYAAMGFGFLESLTYVFGLAVVLKGDSSVIEMVVYALGFALGLYAGILIEGKMAIGYTSIHVTLNHKNEALVQKLRKKGYGVTVYVGEGKLGTRYRMDILTQRKREDELRDYVLNQEPSAFIIAYETKSFKGGYLVKLIQRAMN